jgi:hypothetical protein
MGENLTNYGLIFLCVIFRPDKYICTQEQRQNIMEAKRQNFADVNLSVLFTISGTVGRTSI